MRATRAWAAISASLMLLGPLPGALPPAQRVPGCMSHGFHPLQGRLTGGWMKASHVLGFSKSICICMTRCLEAWDDGEGKFPRGSSLSLSASLSAHSTAWIAFKCSQLRRTACLLFCAWWHSTVAQGEVKQMLWCLFKFRSQEQKCWS